MFEGATRGAACIFSPLIKARSRVSEQLMHIVDWLPTLYTAAGGNPLDLFEIGGALPLDGVSQWSSLVTGSPSPRQSLLVNIDEVLKLEAAINGRHKLVKGDVHLLIRRPCLRIFRWKTDKWCRARTRASFFALSQICESYIIACTRHFYIIRTANDSKLFNALLTQIRLFQAGMKMEDGYYGDTGNDPSYPAYNVEAVLSSAVGVSIGNLTGFASTSARRALWLRKKSVLTCKPLTSPAANCSGTCLFDLSKDPCETTDLSRQLPLVRIICVLYAFYNYSV